MRKPVVRVYDMVRVLFNKPLSSLSVIEPRREKTSLRGFRPGLTQTGLFNHTKLDAWNFWIYM